jgi:glycosyltransferase involved in cell wall biosynthesis
MVQGIPFSLVTTCRNEMRSLARWQKSVHKQSRPPAEIIIVDAFSNDGTAEALFRWATEDSRVVVIQEKGAAAHGRNVAIENTKYEYILSTDMGVQLSPIWCEELIRPFEQDSIVEVVAGSTQIDRESVQTAIARAEYYIENGGTSKLEPGFVVSNRSVAYLKHVWHELGGLPEDLTFYADDSVFGRQILQQGYKMVFAPKAMTYWGRPRELRSFCRESYNYGRGDGEADIKKPYAIKLWEKCLIPPWLVPWLNSCRVIQKQFRFQAAAAAIKSGDIAALFSMPLLLFCRGFHSALGYLDGARRGRLRCMDCRQRLSAQFRH